MSIVWGAVFLGVLPDAWSTAGIVLILGAGLVVSLREVYLAKRTIAKRGPAG
jgi:drug/metabolite transporter (DMT)-like permease